MKLAIIAATGGIGRQVLDQALAAGHDVTAIVRNPDAGPVSPRARRAGRIRPGTTRATDR
ncbi:MAG: NAD(P)H-binding protein [Streptosporangiaceae bacterium]|jgi:putative NADH-flavin reductase